MQIIDNIPVFGDVQENALVQIKNCANKAAYCALMADHHKGYSQPIGGVVAYRDYVSPSGAGFDLSCGNKAVKLNVKASDIRADMSKIMDDIWSNISFGVGRKNKEQVDHELFYYPVWDDYIKHWQKKDLKSLAREQLGTVGSGNHYVDVFEDENGDVWIGCHFGSRGLGHNIATHFLEMAGGADNMDAAPTLISVHTELAQEYLICANLAGEYAYVGRDWVCAKVAAIIGGKIIDEVHNHHNHCWKENHFGEDLYVVRKGATPAFPGQRGFVGGSMGENSVILEGIDSEESKKSLYSTVHGAGRVMSRTEAAGRKKWKRIKEGQHKKLVKVKDGKISVEMMHEWVQNAGVVLRGGGTDESPHCYKRLNEVLKGHEGTIKILHTLKPMGVAMAGENEYDPYKD